MFTFSPSMLAASISSGYSLQDVGSSGWANLTSHLSASNGTRTGTDTGSRIFYIDTVSGTPNASIASQAAALALIHWWDGTNILDAAGNTAPTSGPYNGVPYGTDPFNPSAAVNSFQSYAMVCPKTLGTESVRNLGMNLRIPMHGGGAYRAGFPDAFLFKYGSTYDSYSDVRAYADYAAPTCTFTNGVADISLASNGFAVNQMVNLSNSGGALPTGFAVNTNYFVSATGFVLNTSFQLSATVGGVPIVAGSAGTGTQLITTKIYTFGGALVGAGGSSSTHCSIIAGYGPRSAGRWRVINPVGSNFIHQNSPGSGSHQLIVGGMFDGSIRDRAVRPIDWGSYLTTDGMYGAFLWASISGTSRNLNFEDCHFFAPSSGMNVGALNTYSTPTGTRGVDFDFSVNRCLFSDTWSESVTARTSPAKDGGDADQTFAANTSTAITFPTGGSAQWASDTYTVEAGYANTTVATSFYGRFWYLMDMSGDVAGTIKVALHKNGSEVASKTIAGTGNTTYQLHGTLRDPETGVLGLGAGTADTFKIVVTTTSATGTMTVLGKAKSRLVVDRISGTKGAGGGTSLYMFTGAGGAWRHHLTNNFFVRGGLNADPLLKSTFMPDGVGTWDYNALNHNSYFVGDADLLGCIEENNFWALGGAGVVRRCPSVVRKNFIYDGYDQIVPEHAARVYSTASGNWDDNVLQRYAPTVSAAAATSHPGWGLVASSGMFDLSVQRNIVSCALYNGAWGLKIGSVTDPYFAAGNHIGWTNDTTVTVAGNQLDALGLGVGSGVLEEANGETTWLGQWNTPITGFSVSAGVGTVLTCTPTAGSTGTAAYQWYRILNLNALSLNGYASNAGNITAVGTNSSTYTLTAPTCTFTNGVADIGLTAHGFKVGQMVNLFNSGGALPTNFAVNTNYFVSATGLTANAFQLATTAGGTPIVAGSAGTGTQSVTGDFYGASGARISLMICIVTGITYSPGIGISGTMSGNVLVRPAAAVNRTYYNIGSTSSSGNIPSVGLPSNLGSIVPSDSLIAVSSLSYSGIAESTSTVYNSAAAAQAGVAGATNWNASTVTYAQSLGITVASYDGMSEIYDIVVAGTNNPQLNAMQRGKWDLRLTDGAVIGNHFRSARGMATV